MRYRDAIHMDMGSFYARQPQLGKMYRFLGYAAIIGVVWHHQDVAMLERLLIMLVVLWLMAWYRIVGALWRSSIVSACVLCAFFITWHRVWAAPIHHGVTP
jgi:hypothetical protein